MLTKDELAGALKETGLLLRLKGANKFKTKAYVAAARTIQKTSRDVDLLVRENRLRELPGIGDSLASYITQMYLEGESPLLNKLRAELPAGAAELSQVEGLTLTKIKQLNKELNITSITQLEDACRAGKVAGLKGFGIKQQNDLLQAIASLDIGIHEMRLINALELARVLVSYLKKSLKTDRVELAGTMRRWHETIERITIVVEASEESVSAAMNKCRRFISVERDETEKGFVGIMPEGISAAVHAVENLAVGLAAFTGTASHFAQLRQVAEKADLVWEQDRLLDKRGKAISITSEPDLFNVLGLQFIPPELREGEDEVRLAKRNDFSDLVDLDDIRGMTHCHSNYSDGIHTIEQMARAAQKMGMDYITITDHSPTAHYANGLSVERLKRQWEEIDKVQEKVKICILKGTECDILSDGALDYPDDILEQFDVIIASIHSRYRQGKEQMTRRLLNGLRNPHFKIWGHPLGRLVLHRAPIPCDVEEVLQAIADANVAIEINGDPYRLDLPPHWAKVAKRVGLKFVISTDAHSTSDLDNLEFGIRMARRAGLTRKDVLNASPVSTFLRQLNKVA